MPAAARVVPAMAGWISRGNRENQAQPLLWFRQSVRLNKPSGGAPKI